MNRALLLILGVLIAAAAHAGVPTYGYEVVNTWPHDRSAYTQGLFMLDGRLYESTGEVGRSTIREVDLESGEVVRMRRLPPPWYGEGIVDWKDKLYQITWRDGRGFIYERESFNPVGEFRYPGEGWGLTRDDKHIYMSDGTPVIRVLDPETFAQVGRIQVTWDGHPVANLNELEWVKGEIYANVWLTNRIARIDPETGNITGFIDLAGLAPIDKIDPQNDVLNGIAYDAENDRLFVTGKRWPHLYEIRVVAPKAP